MSNHKNVMAKSWEVQGLLGELAPHPSFAMPSAKLALIVFMIIVTVLFSLFTVSYYLRMTLGDWVPLESPSMLWLNTGLLLLSSICLQRARSLSRHPAANVTAPFVAGGLFALAFIGGQVLVWQQLNAQGLFIASNPANTFFYLLTGAHIAHLLGGLWVWGKTSILLQRRETGKDLALSIELCTLYWHFLLLVWIGLFAILANS